MVLLIKDTKQNNFVISNLESLENLFQGFFVTFKKKLMRLLSTLFIFTVILGCQSETRENPRAYVEGNITETKLEFAKIKVLIKSDNAIVAETIPSGSGDFTLSGPLLSDSFSLVFNAKIKSFKASKSGSTISSDSLQILIPAGTTYITFNEIKLK